jgi:hypothetical protein
MLGDPGSEFRQGKQIFSFIQKTAQTGSDPHPIFYSMYTGVLSQG